MDVAIGIAKKLCFEQGRVFDLAAMSGFILFAATKRVIVMSVPPEDREQFLTAWNTRLKTEGKAELIVEGDGSRGNLTRNHTANLPALDGITRHRGRVVEHSGRHKRETGPRGA